MSNETDTSGFSTFLREFMGESDRAAVVLGAAKLDLLLRQIIEKVLLASPGKSDDLFDGDSPLSTFSAKINLAYRLGLIDAALTRSLHLIRKIRNDFAHEPSGVSLEEGSHRDRVRELVAPLLQYEEFKGFIKAGEETHDLPGSSLKFRVLLGWIAWMLEKLFEYCQTLSPRITKRLIPGNWEKEKIEVGSG